jgi:hypothetical protein
MRLTCRSGLGRSIACVGFLLLAPPAHAQVGQPSDEEVANLLRNQPISLQNCNVWQPRLRSWLNDHNSRR